MKRDNLAKASAINSEIEALQRKLTAVRDGIITHPIFTYNGATYQIDIINTKEYRVIMGKIIEDELSKLIIKYNELDKL